jgi:hypothetical protein
MAVFLAIASRDVISKIAAIWWPVVCFAGLGTEHVVANMYFIPLALFLGAPEPLTVSFYIWKSMIPSLLGNIVGGGFFVGAVYWYMHLADGQEVEMPTDEKPTKHTIYEQGKSIVVAAVLISTDADVISSEADDRADYLQHEQCEHWPYRLQFHRTDIASEVVSGLAKGYQARDFQAERRDEWDNSMKSNEQM